MRINELADAIAEFMQWSFTFLEALGNYANWGLIVVSFFLCVYWVRLMGRQNREARENGTLK
ncbi:MAG: hypothetical protein AAGB22_02645 [Bacteroidota bacterium]